jgi:hypothetical protein
VDECKPLIWGGSLERLEGALALALAELEAAAAAAGVSLGVISGTFGGTVHGTVGGTVSGTVGVTGSYGVSIQHQALRTNVIRPAVLLRDRPGKGTIVNKQALDRR